MNIRHGRALKLFALTSLCASLLTACNSSLFNKDNSAADAVVETAAPRSIKSTSTVIDFKIIATQNMAHRGSLSLNDIAKRFPQLNERAQMLASVDQIYQTDAGIWDFYSNYKMLFTMASPDGQNLQIVNSADPMFNTVVLGVNAQSKLAETIRFNLSDCQHASADACDVVDAIIYVQTVSGTPSADQGQDQSQDKDQDKDQDQSQDKDQDVTQDIDQDKDQDKDQDTGQDQDQNGSGQTPTNTIIRF